MDKEEVKKKIVVLWNEYLKYLEDAGLTDASDSWMHFIQWLEYGFIKDY